mmetsp:Transcript_5833/g.24713  ORF Transcript_5833/g.24713 Transcript_5833/m.24713 type:complete len:303 (+) Transcript_5833:221-1129(+)
MPRVPATDPAAEAERGATVDSAKNRSEPRHRYAKPRIAAVCSRARPPTTYLCLKYAGAHHAVHTRNGNAASQKPPTCRNFFRNAAASGSRDSAAAMVTLPPTKNRTSKHSRSATKQYPGQCSWSWNAEKSSVNRRDAISRYAVAAANAKRNAPPASTPFATPAIVDEEIVAPAKSETRAAPVLATPTKRAGCCNARVTLATRRLTSGLSSSKCRAVFTTATTPSLKSFPARRAEEARFPAAARVGSCETSAPPLSSEFKSLAPTEPKDTVVQPHARNSNSAATMNSLKPWLTSAAKSAARNV